VPDGPATDCVESYDHDPSTLTNRRFAFDGTVAAVGDPVSERRSVGVGYVGVTFEVHEWFTGGSGATVTVDLLPAGAYADLGRATAWGVGTRLLVSGMPRWDGPPLDAPVGWPCGFTRYYDPATADAWRTAFASRTPPGS